MFGYVRINKMDLTFREFDYYKGYYCGLCKYLKENHGEVSRLSLNYDITFLIVILTALYKLDSDITYERCIANPLKKKMRIVNEITEYAASMNILLSYYKLEDNLYDDNGIKDKLAYELYKGKLKKAYEKYPQKAEYIKQQLGNLRELEKQESKSIDKVSNTFGNLMGEIFVYKKDEYEQNLRNIGFNLGKYIYILDAYEDLEEDNKKGRYNPFIDYIDKKEELKNKVDRLISMSLGMATKNIEQLNLEFNKSIIDNIIYSGVYLRYKSILEKGCESNVHQGEFGSIRNLISKNEFQKAYDLLQKISNKCSEWYYLTGLSAMNIGYYDEGEEYIKTAATMEPTNEEYSHAFNQYNQYRNDYNRNSYNYNRRKQNDLGGCCCCCGDDCCDTLCQLWCADQCCECCGGDLITCC